MTHATGRCPATRSTVIDLYFMEHRAKLLDIAAFLDRVDRADVDADPTTDNRLAAMQQAIDILRDDRPERARRMQELFSDMTDEPIEKAPMQGAVGVPPDRRYDAP